MITDYKITEIFCATDEFSKTTKLQKFSVLRMNLVRNLMKRLKICLFWAQGESPAEDVLPACPTVRL